MQWQIFFFIFYFFVIIRTLQPITERDGELSPQCSCQSKRAIWLGCFHLDSFTEQGVDFDGLNRLFHLNGNILNS